MATGSPQGSTGRRFGSNPMHAVARTFTALTLTALVAACGVKSPTEPNEHDEDLRQPRVSGASSMKISPQQPVLDPGDGLLFTVQLRDEMDRLIEADRGNIKWSATGGTISSKGFYQAGSANGLYMVKAWTVGSLGGLSDSTTVQIGTVTTTTPRQATPTSIAISPQTAELLPGGELQFTAELRDQNGDPMSGTITWSATGGTITDEGAYTAGGQTGSYRVTASSGGLSASASVTISDSATTDPDLTDPDTTEPEPTDPKAVATSISISPTSASVLTGGSVQFTAEVRDQNGALMTASITWSATGGTIDGGLYVAGSQTGTYQVTASSSGLSASASVKISAPSSSLSGVEVYPGQSIQAAVDKHPAGTTFVIKAGTHRRQSVQPKDGMTFAGESGAILDGETVVAYAFDGVSRASNVTIRGLIIENYANSQGQGAIRGANHSHWLTEDWVIEGCEVRYTRGGMGIRTGNRMIVRNNHLHHNDQYGVGGGGDDVLVVGNEIAYSNYRDTESVNSGGTKFVTTNRLVVRNNYVHHNHGPGLWTDIDNVNVLIEGNRIEDNHQQGIFHEISHSAVIRNNIVRRNGLVNKSGWLYDAGILIAHSDNVEVYGNTVEGNWNGITGVQQDRGDGRQLKNLWVHDNTVSMSRGHTGIGKTGTNSYDPFNANNRFDRNSYEVATDLSKPFKWSGQLTWSGWRSAGQDVNGTLQVD